MDTAREAGNLSGPEAEIIKDLVEKRTRKLADAYYGWIRLRAEALVHYPAHRYAIETLATELLEIRTMDPRQAHKRIDAALKEFAAVKGKA